MRIASKLKPTLLALALIGTLSLGGCATTTVGSGKIDMAYCQSFRPITWSAKDTDRTIHEAKAHNAVGKKICGWRAGVGA